MLNVPQEVLNVPQRLDFFFSSFMPLPFRFTKISQTKLFLAALADLYLPLVFVTDPLTKKVTFDTLHTFDQSDDAFTKRQKYKWTNRQMDK